MFGCGEMWAGTDRQTAVTNTPHVPGMHRGGETEEEGADGRLRSAEGEGASLATEEEEEASSSTTHQLIRSSRSGTPPARAPFSLRRHVIPALLSQPPGFPAVSAGRGAAVCARASGRVSVSGWQLRAGIPLSLPQSGHWQRPPRGERRRASAGSDVELR